MTRRRLYVSPFTRGAVFSVATGVLRAPSKVVRLLFLLHFFFRPLCSPLFRILMVRSFLRSFVRSFVRWNALRNVLPKFSLDQEDDLFEDSFDEWDTDDEEEEDRMYSTSTSRVSRHVCMRSSMNLSSMPMLKVNVDVNGGVESGGKAQLDPVPYLSSSLACGNLKLAAFWPSAFVSRR